MIADFGRETLNDAFGRVRDLDLSLQEQLRTFAATVRRERPEFAAAVDRLVEQLRQYGAGESAPRIGEPMPPFVLPDETGRMVSLEELLNRAPVAVTFHRGHWCPYCRININALAQAHRQLSAGEGQIVAIMPDRQKFVADLKLRSNVPFPILTDMDNGYALSLNLTVWVGAEIQKNDGRPSGPSGFSGKRLLDAPDSGYFRCWPRRAHKGALHRSRLSQPDDDRGYARGNASLIRVPRRNSIDTNPQDYPARRFESPEPARFSSARRAAIALLPNHFFRMASRTNAPTPDEYGRPLTVTRFTFRQNSGSTTGKATTPGYLAAFSGMKAKPSPAATMARVQSSRSLQ